MEIVGQGTLPNGTSAKIWKYTYDYSYRTYIDSLWVTDSSDIITVYTQPCRTCSQPFYYERLRYILPLKVSNYWYSDAPYSDTTKVLDQENVVVPAGSYGDVFRISKNIGYVTNSWTRDTIYFKPYIGLVKFNQFEIDLGPVIGNGTWELTGYNF